MIISGITSITKCAFDNDEMDLLMIHLRIQIESKMYYTLHANNTIKEGTLLCKFVPLSVIISIKYVFLQIFCGGKLDT